MPSFILTMVTLISFNSVEEDLANFSKQQNDKLCDSEEVREVFNFPMVANICYFLIFILHSFVFIKVIFLGAITTAEEANYLNCVSATLGFLGFKISSSAEMTKNALSFECFKTEEKFDDFTKSLEILIFVETFCVYTIMVILCLFLIFLSLFFLRACYVGRINKF